MNFKKHAPQIRKLLVLECPISITLVLEAKRLHTLALFSNCKSVFSEFVQCVYTSRACAYCSTFLEVRLFSLLLRVG